MKRIERPMLGWVIDNREQTPYQLAAPDPTKWEDGGFYFDTLAEGDLTCEVNCTRVSVIVERKSLPDYLKCVGKDRVRFENELARLAAYHVAHIIIEAPFAQIRAKQQYSRLSPLSAANSIAAWATDYPNLHFWTVTNWREGQVWARTLLHMAAKRHLTEGEV